MSEKIEITKAIIPPEYNKEALRLAKQLEDYLRKTSKEMIATLEQQYKFLEQKSIYVATETLRNYYSKVYQVEVIIPIEKVFVVEGCLDYGDDFRLSVDGLSLVQDEGLTHDFELLLHCGDVQLKYDKSIAFNDTFSDRPRVPEVIVLNGLVMPFYMKDNHIIIVPLNKVTRFTVI